jgi:tRNA pseudouridine13 synthase
VAKYRNVLMHLRDNPDDWAGAFLQIETRYRALLIFEFQSWLWNEGVRRLLQGFLPERDLISLRYQAGRLLFPREVSGDILRDLRERSFPLLAPDTEYADDRTREAAEATLAREHLRLPDLKMQHLPSMFFKHEERQVLIYPGKLVVSEPNWDEMNRGRLKVNVAFTLPPGAYATLVTKRLFWFAMLEEEALSQGELHPTAQHALESAFGPSGIRAELRESERKPRRRVDPVTAAATTIATGLAAAAVDQKPSHAVEIAAAVAEAPKKKMGFRERQKRKKDEKAAARAQQPNPAGTGKRAAAKRAARVAAAESGKAPKRD